MFFKSEKGVALQRDKLTQSCLTCTPAENFALLGALAMSSTHKGHRACRKRKCTAFRNHLRKRREEKKQSYMHFTHWVNKLLNLPPLIQFSGHALSPFRGVADSEVASHPSGGTCTSPKARPCPGDFPSPPVLDLRPGFSAAEPSPLCPLLVCGHSPARASPRLLQVGHGGCRGWGLRDWESPDL